MSMVSYSSGIGNVMYTVVNNRPGQAVRLVTSFISYRGKLH